MWRNLQSWTEALVGKGIRKENVKCSRKTKFERGKPFGFIWTLENFDKDVRGKEIVLSPIFVDGNSTHSWRLKLTQTKNQSSMNWLGVYLMYEGRTSVRACFTISIIDSHQKILQTSSAGGDYQVMIPRHDHGFDSFMQLPNLYRAIGHDKALHLYCEVGVEEQIYTSSDGSIRQTQMRTLPPLENFETVVLETKNGPIPAIKNILAARSPVFATMFGSEHFRESAEATMKIEDFDADIVQGMLDYVYTGRTGSLLTSAADLLQIADKYQILDLKRECEEVVEANLTIHNAAQILIIANLHSPDNLKPKVVDFLNRFIRDAQNRQNEN